MTEERTWKLLIMQWIVDAKRTDLDAIEVVGRIIPATTEDTSDRKEARIINGESSVETSTKFCEVAILWSIHVGTDL
jgi:hypothetical protein